MEKYPSHADRKELEHNYNKMKLKTRLEANSNIEKFLAKGGKIERYNGFNKEIRVSKIAKETWHTSRDKTIEQMGEV